MADTLVEDKPLEGELLRNGKGQYVQGKSGNRAGRPLGSKNKVNLAKLLLEEAFRERNEERIAGVLDLIVSQALEGDKASQKLIWDATVSKANVSEDKAAGNKQEIIVHRMQVNQNPQGDNDGEDI